MTEILAPAGNMEMLKAAVVNGADAVYLGLDKFSARAKAENFEGEKLLNAINFAHLFGVKVYVAINTVIKSGELDEAIALAEYALSLKADALILQDYGLSAILRKKFPYAVLHASTQMGIHNLEGAEIAKKLGFSRIILSRETLFEDIVKIKQGVDIEIECFVQGALCIAFSGNCYFSSFASGLSGNRGKCMQLCRKLYDAEIDGRHVNGYLLSAKDLMLADKVAKLSEYVDCFKIEGRLRRSEYVAESVRVYKKALKGEFSDSDLAALKKVFNRGDYTYGHIFNPTNKVLDVDLCSHKGLKIGSVVGLKAKRVQLSCHMNAGDGVKFLRHNKEVGNASINESGFFTSYEGKVRIGDDVNITTDVKFNSEVMSRTRKIPVNVFVDFDRKLFSVKCNDITVKQICNEAVPALTQAITEKDLIENFSKSTLFEPVSVTVKGQPSFLVKSVFNGIRRSLYETLTAKLLANYEQNMPKFNSDCPSMSDIISNDLNKFLNNRPIYQVESVDQITEDMEVIAINPREYSIKALSEFARFYDRALLNLPVLARGKDMQILKEIVAALPLRGYIVNNLYGIDIVPPDKILLGYGMNVINDVLDVPKIYSIESDTVLNNGYTYARGNIPLMNFCHCMKKELSNDCKNCRGYDITLLYEGRRFFLRRYKIHYCYAQLTNCADLALKKMPSKAFIDYSFRRTGLTTKGNYGRGLK